MKKILHMSITQADTTPLEDLPAVKELDEQELACVIGGFSNPGHDHGHGHDHDHSHDHDHDWHNWHNWHHHDWHNWHHHDEHDKHHRDKH